jgi:hypothetical protein
LPERDPPSGRHVLAVQTDRQNYPDWLQVTLKHKNRIIGTDGTLKFTFTPADGRQTMDFDDSSWDSSCSVWVKGTPEEL